MLLQVPLNLVNGQAKLGHVSVVEQTTGILQNVADSQVSSAKNNLTNLKEKLAKADAQYQKDPTPANFQAVEAIRAQIKNTERELRIIEIKRNATYKRTIEELRNKIKSLRERLKSATHGEKKVLTERLDRLIIRYYNLRIDHVTEIINKNRTNASRIRRRITKHRDVIMAIKAREKGQVIPDGVMKTRKAEEIGKLKKAKNDLIDVDKRFRKLNRILERLKAAKYRFNEKRMITAAILEHIKTKIKNMKQTVDEHDHILRNLVRKNKTCGDLELAQRRLDKALNIYKLRKNENKKRPTPATRRRLRNSHNYVTDLRMKIKQIRKCKGIMLCGNLKKITHKLEVARKNLKRAEKTATDRPSDEDAQKEFKKYKDQVKKYKTQIKATWDCICYRAQIKYHENKRLYSQTGKRIYKDKMLRHQKMMKTCNCRAGNINFGRARFQFIKYRNRFQANTMDQKSKEQMDFYYKKVMEHYNRLKMYKCALPRLPRTITKA